MNLVSGSRLWIEKNPILHKYTYLSEDIDCEVVIVGGGIIGCICAYYLTEAGVKTILVDKNIIGYSSTSASTSILQYEIDYELRVLSAMLGFDNALKAFKFCEKAVYDIENVINKLEDKCDFSLKDCLYYTENASDIEGIRKEYELRKENGFNVEYINKENVRGNFSFKLEAGIYSKSGAAQIDPYRFAHELIHQSSKKGLIVFENTEVTSIQNHKDFITAETVNNRKIKAKKVVISTGYEAINMVKQKICIPYRSFTIASKPIENFQGWYNKCLIRDNKEFYNYIRPTADNRIIMGGEDVAIGGSYSKMSTLKGSDKAVKQKYSILEGKLRSMFPNIKNISIEYRFNGIFGITKDGLPYAGEYSELPNHYFCLSYGSNGILYGILGAQLIRDLYFGNNNQARDLFSLSR